MSSQARQALSPSGSNPTLQLKQEACLIGGAWVVGDRWLDVLNPANDQVIGRVPLLGAPEAERAVEAAAAAFPAWSSQTARARSALLRRFHDLMLFHAETLAVQLASEQGKPRTEARSEIQYAADYLDWFSEEARRAYGDVIPTSQVDKRSVVLRQPVGVVGIITPWNFPAAMIARKLAPAVAAGCTVVIKPAEQTPFTALALGVLAEAAGIPPGVVNIVTGDAVAIGRVLTSHPLVRKISFTGSTATGARLMAQSADTIKKLSLELGGNAPFIVFDDADLVKAVAGAVVSKFRNAGQTCVCANRFYVQSGIHDRFVAALVDATGKLRVGPSNDPAAEIGPLIDAKAVAKVSALVADGLVKGARIEVGGGPHACGANFYTPTVLTGVSETMRLVTEETFGPIAPIVKFETEADVVEMANRSPFGLASYVYTQDLSRAWRVSEALEAGMVGVNTGMLSSVEAPFGGVKQSGLGREGSRYGLDDYMEMKYLSLGL